MADIAHIAGLIAGKALYNPVPICDIVTTTTHKTLRWPRWAIIMSKQKYEKNLSSAVFPGIQWWPHENLIAAKAVAFKEAMNESFREYANQVIKNTKRFSENLINSGIKIISWWSDNHLLLIDIYSSFWIWWQEAESILEKSWIIVNKNMVPYDTRKPMNPSWIRIWTAAITTRWMKENEIDIISNLFIETIKNRWNLEKISEIKKRVLALCEKFPIYRNMTV
jgi:glycine hydroxymethyltransferase